MDFIPKVKLKTQPDDTEIDEETGEETPNFIYDDDDSEEEEIKKSTYIPQQKQEPIVEEDIFVSKPKKAIPTDGKKTRKPMSEEHKEKLKFARDKALIVRRARAEERKQAKDMDKQEKDLLKLKRQKELNQLKKELEDESKPKVVFKEEPTPQIREIIKEVIKEPTITKKDLEDAQLDAIIKYEALRKDRKAKKKVDVAQKAHEEAVRQRILKAMRPNNQFNSRYSGF